MHNSSDGNHKFHDHRSNLFTKHPSFLKRDGARSQIKPFALTDVVDVDFEDVDDKAHCTKFEIPNGISAAQRRKKQTSLQHRAFSTSTGRLDLFNANHGPMRRALGWPALVAGLSLTAAVFVFLALGVSPIEQLGARWTDAEPSGGLILSDVRLKSPGGTQPYSYIEGAISNGTIDDLDVPLIAVQIEGQKVDAVPFFVRPVRGRLSAGQTTRFRGRVPAPARNHTQLSVSLAGGGSAR